MILHLPISYSMRYISNNLHVVCMDGESAFRNSYSPRYLGVGEF